MRIFFLNSLACGVLVVRRACNGSGGGPSKGTSTLPFAQQLRGQTTKTSKETSFLWIL